ncbi:MAG: hypothetical protein KatS3mg029_0559 [Saprospiraceae bacterium]|nr:MAG: hypothetical protein KatS3mg029_0559 [Saprospiraceae bacterium]
MIPTCPSVDYQAGDLISPTLRTIDFGLNPVNLA